MVENIQLAFDEVNDDFLKFELVVNKRSHRPDLHAFMLLDDLVPGKSDIVSVAEHDEIFLDIDETELSKVATKDQICELTRCGVRWSTECGGLAMFV